jgi:outer membrane usher protein
LLFRYNKRNRVQASISQNLAGVSLYLNGYQQDYWGTSKKERSLSLGFNTVLSGVSYHLAYTYSKTNDEEADRMVSFGFSVPLTRWLPARGVAITSATPKMATPDTISASTERCWTTNV